MKKNNGCQYANLFTNEAKYIHKIGIFVIGNGHFAKSLFINFIWNVEHRGHKLTQLLKVKNGVSQLDTISGEKTTTIQKSNE